MGSIDFRRRFPVGAEIVSEGGVHFRVWAPQRTRVHVIVEQHGREPDTIEMDAEEGGYFSAVCIEAGAGSLYRFRLDEDDEFLYPDPASRFQPQGPHGPSRVVDPSVFTWSDGDWKGHELKGQVIYELHIGTYTPEGTWSAATQQLKYLAELGINVIEMMPIADFPGHFGWGYDGVCLFAPTRLYGEPDDLRRFVDEAHRQGISVVLDVVYNHLGPDGNFLPEFSADYFTGQEQSDWGGDAINFDGKNSPHVREFFLANARYWIEEFHMDGLRLDATQAITDRSKHHIIAEITRTVREAARGRKTIIIGENEPQNRRMLDSYEDGGYGIDGLWNDDFHHSAMVAVTGRRQAYYADYHGAPQEFVSAAKYGYLFQGQRYKWQKAPRGTPTLDLPPEKFINFLQNHDQIANSLRGERLHKLTSPGRYRAITALLLLAPETPLLFQGQEFNASSPFLYFADLNKALADGIRRGRAEFMRQFRSLAQYEAQRSLLDPVSPRTFRVCKIDPSERDRNREAAVLYRDLLRLRRDDPVLSRQTHRGIDGAVLDKEAFVLRFFDPGGDDRLLIVNLGEDLHLDPAPEPLLAPPREMLWDVLWSSESVVYGGNGTAPVYTKRNWEIPGHASIVMSPVVRSTDTKEI